MDTYRLLRLAQQACLVTRAWSPWHEISHFEVCWQVHFVAGPKRNAAQAETPSLLSQTEQQFKPYGSHNPCRYGVPMWEGNTCNCASATAICWPGHPAQYAVADQLMPYIQVTTCISMNSRYSSHLSLRLPPESGCCCVCIHQPAALSQSCYCVKDVEQPAPVSK